MSKDFKRWLRTWDQGNFDFTEHTAGPMHKEVQEKTVGDKEWQHQIMPTIAEKEVNIYRHFYPVATVILSVIMILFLILSVEQLPPFGSASTPANESEVVVRYVEKGMEETGAVNVVAGVILDYRAFDTLGESHVLFTATIAVLMLLLQDQEEEEKKKIRMILQGDLVLQNTAKVLVPLIILFGVYVILGGHIGPGGGFAGGAIIGSGLILYSGAFGAKNMQKVISMKTYPYIVLCALMTYSLSKCYSFFCGANGLHTIFTTGIPGRIFSAGLILPLNVAVGVVVACTMYGFYCIFTRGRI